MKFCTTLIAVRDMERSLRFYRNLFGQEVTQDLGWNKTLTCGLTLQEHFDELAGFPAETMKYQPNTMELYFETETFDEFLTLLLILGSCNLYLYCVSLVYHLQEFGLGCCGTAH